MTQPPFSSAPSGAFFFTARRRLAWLPAFVLLIFGGLPATLVHAVDLPASMLIDGSIGRRFSLPPVAADKGDRVLAFSAADGQLVGQGLVADGGEFVVEAISVSGFNNAPVRLELQKGRLRYALMQEGVPAILAFRGGLLPRRLTLGLRIGNVTAMLPDVAATNGPTRANANDSALCDPETMDVNGDGACDGEDLAILSLYGAGVTRSAPVRRSLP